MQALFVTLIILAALLVLVPMMFMVGAFYRTIVASFHTPERAPTPPEDREGLVDSRG